MHPTHHGSLKHPQNSHKAPLGAALPTSPHPRPQAEPVSLTCTADGPETTGLGMRMVHLANCPCSSCGRCRGHPPQGPATLCERSSMRLSPRQVSWAWAEDRCVSAQDSLASRYPPWPLRRRLSQPVMMGAMLRSRQGVRALGSSLSPSTAIHLTAVAQGRAPRRYRKLHGRRTRAASPPVTAPDAASPLASELLLLPVTREGGRPHPRQPTSGASMRRWVSRAVPADCGTQICPPAGPSRPRVWAHLPSPPLPPWPRGPCPGCRGHGVASGAAASFQAQYPQRELRKGGAAAASPQSWASPVATVGEAQAPALRAQGREDRERTCRHPDRSHQRCGRQQTRCWTQGAAVTGLRVEGGPPAR